LAGQTSLSIYSDGRVVVRRTLTQALQKGRNTFTLKVEGLDGATLFSPDTAVALVSAVVRPPTVPDAALAAAAGQTLSFIGPRAGKRYTRWSWEAPGVRCRGAQRSRPSRSAPTQPRCSSSPGRSIGHGPRLRLHRRIAPGVSRSRMWW